MQRSSRRKKLQWQNKTSQIWSESLFKSSSFRYFAIEPSYNYRERSEKRSQVEERIHGMVYVPQYHPSTQVGRNAVCWLTAINYLIRWGQDKELEDNLVLCWNGFWDNSGKPGAKWKTKEILTQKNSKDYRTSFFTTSSLKSLIMSKTDEDERDSVPDDCEQTERAIFTCKWGCFF